MIPLAKVSVGMLELFRARSSGRNPDQIESSIRPIIDSTEMFGADLVVNAHDPGGAGGIARTLIGTAAFPGRLLAASGFVIVGAAPGTQIRLSYSLRVSSAVNATYLGQAVVTAPVAAATYHVVAQLVRPIVFRPGWQFILECAGDAAGVDHQVTRREMFENYAPA